MQTCYHKCLRTLGESSTCRGKIIMIMIMIIIIIIIIIISINISINLKLYDTRIASWKYFLLEPFVSPRRKYFISLFSLELKRKMTLQWTHCTWANILQYDSYERRILPSSSSRHALWSNYIINGRIRARDSFQSVASEETQGHKRNTRNNPVNST